MNQNILTGAQKWQYVHDAHLPKSRTIAGYQIENSESDICLHWLHGNGFTGAAYAGVLNLLSKHFNVMTTDMLGHGLSDKSAFSWPNWRLLSQDVFSAVQQQPLYKTAKKRIAIGHSMGGVLSVLAAAKHKDLFDEIILLDPVLFIDVVLAYQMTMKHTGLWQRSGFINAVTNRQQHWATKKEAAEVLSKKALYRDWDDESFAGFIQDALMSIGEGQGRNGVSLSCDPSWEAKIFSGYPEGLWQAVRDVDVPVHMFYADKSYPFITRAAKKATRLNSHFKTQLFSEGHCFPMTDAKATAELIESIVTAKL